MTTTRDLPRNKQAPAAEPDPDGETVRRRRVGETIIVPFDEISDDGPEPIRVASLDPVPAPRPPSQEQTLVQVHVPMQVPGSGSRRSGVVAAVSSVPEWAWVAGAMVLFALGAFGVMLVGVGIAVYVYVT